MDKATPTLRSTLRLAAEYLVYTMLVAVVAVQYMATPIAAMENQPVEIISAGQDVNIPDNPIVVGIEQFSYSPDSITVPANGTVIWANQEPFDHDVTFKVSNVLSEELISPKVGKGGKILVRFNKPGEYRYYCHLHPFMEGTVHVKAE